MIAPSPEVDATVSGVMGSEPAAAAVFVGDHETVCASFSVFSVSAGEATPSPDANLGVTRKSYSVAGERPETVVALPGVELTSGVIVATLQEFAPLSDFSTL